MKDTLTRESRTQGALLGFAAGDALGATTEFMQPEMIREVLGLHTEIIGEGVFNWRPGQGTDDSDLMFALARTYRAGYSLKGAANRYLKWLDFEQPRDIGGTTHAALTHYRKSRNPKISGRRAHTRMAAGNGSLMCALPTGLVPMNRGTRCERAAELSRITHFDKRCVESCIAYVNIVANLLDGLDPRDAVWEVAGMEFIHDVDDVLRRAPLMRFDDLSFSGFVLDSLTVAVWAVCQLDDTLEDLLIAIVNQGNDADTTAAIAGGLLGARDGIDAVPERWVEKLEYREEALQLGEAFARMHRS